MPLTIPRSTAQINSDVAKRAVIVNDAKLVISLIGVGCKTMCGECIGNGL
jgi:hypothetical protein